MARTALKVKQIRQEKRRVFALESWKKMIQPTKHYNRCKITGRSKAYMREFGVDRVTFRKYARLGMIMGVKKASW